MRSGLSGDPDGAGGIRANIEVAVIEGDRLMVHYVGFTQDASGEVEISTGEGGEPVPESDEALPQSAGSSDVQQTPLEDASGTLDFDLDDGAFIRTSPMGANTAEPQWQIIRERISLPAVWVVVGTYFSAKTETSAYFRFDSGATSSLGVATSGTGKFGSWKSEGAWTSDASQVLDWDKQNGIRRSAFQSQWRYEKQRIWKCVDPDACWTYYRAVPKRALASDRVYHPRYPLLAWRCVEQTGTAHRSTTNEHAVTWSNGVDLKGILGIQLSAKSGYSQAIKLGVRSGGGKRYLCGTAAEPGQGYFGQLVVRPRT